MWCANGWCCMNCILCILCNNLPMDSVEFNFNISDKIWLRHVVFAITASRSIITKLMANDGSGVWKWNVKMRTFLVKHFNTRAGNECSWRTAYSVSWVTFLLDLYAGVSEKPSLHSLPLLRFIKVNVDNLAFTRFFCNTKLWSYT